MSKTLVLIDADGLAYLGSKTDKLLQILEKVDYKINTIIEKTQADYAALFISQGKYFRHYLKDKTEPIGSYKSNRTYNNQIYNGVIKEYLKAHYKANSYNMVEADDAIVYWMNTPIYWCDPVEGDTFLTTNPNEGGFIIECNKVLAAVDKDLLKAVPGRHLNYNKKTGPEEWQMVWVDTSDEIKGSPLFKASQLLIGDYSDGVKGINGIGPVKAHKMLENCLSPEEYYTVVFRKYLSEYGISKGIYEFQKAYRLLHLLESDEDFLREVGYTPKLPNFIKINKTSIEDTLFK